MNTFLDNGGQQGGGVKLKGLLSLIYYQMHSEMCELRKDDLVAVRFNAFSVW